MRELPRHLMIFIYGLILKKKKNIIQHLFIYMVLQEKNIKMMKQGYI